MLLVVAVVATGKQILLVDLVVEHMLMVCGLPLVERGVIQKQVHQMQ